MARAVRVRQTHGRSIPYTFKGISTRLRKGEEARIPYEVYLRYRHKLELLEGGTGTIPGAKTTQVTREETATREAEPEEPLHWPMKVSPEDYLDSYGDYDDPSPTVRKRLALAKKILASK